MRKERGKYKVCSRLGYNARLRQWSPGTKKKWEKTSIWRSSEKQKEGVGLGEKGYQVSNGVIRFPNEERRGEWKSIRTKGKKVIRRKDIHGRVQSQKTGRKRRYGNVPSKRIRKSLLKQRKAYKEVKRRKERTYRKGAEEKRDQKEQIHRRSGIEIRVDRRRWRSGRVPTLQMSRDLIEHGKIEKRIGRESGEKERLKWQGEELKVGQGRKVKEDVWGKRKERSRGLLEKPDYGRSISKYREVDYVTGRRVLVRVPRSSEVLIPKNIELSVSTYL